MMAIVINAHRAALPILIGESSDVVTSVDVVMLFLPLTIQAIGMGSSSVPTVTSFVFGIDVFL
jgi:hypothetical protein